MKAMEAEETQHGHSSWNTNGMFARCLREKRATVYDDTNVDDVIEGKRNFCLEEKLQDDKFTTAKQCLLEMEGKDFNLKYIQEHGFNTPMLFKSKDGLNITVPNPDLFSVNDVKSYVGARRIIDVFDCDTHSPEKMTLHQFVRYYMSQEKEKLLNVTSLEVSQTGLARLVDCPTTITEDLDWVPLVWPKNLIKGQKDATNAVENMKYPKVRKYCLMSVGGCYTDFHIDFGGTSVWYHVLKGSKVFWLIPPTDENLEIYERWVLSERQQDVFFGDVVEDCFRIQLVAGDTFMIPTGWIHSVYTPEDSLVFGGNYLHSFNIPMQLRIHDIEETTHVPKHLRFPFFAEIHWYLVKMYVEILERDMDERRKLEFEGDDSANEEEDDEKDVFKLINDEMNKKEEDTEEKSQHSPKSPKPTKWQCVHLTVFELEGLKTLCERLRSWSHAKINYPKDFGDDSMELLDRLEEMLQYHEEDDQILACSGNNIFKQYAMDKGITVSPKSSPQKNKSSSITASGSGDEVVDLTSKTSPSPKTSPTKPTSTKANKEDSSPADKSTETPPDKKSSKDSTDESTVVKKKRARRVRVQKKETDEEPPTATTQKRVRKSPKKFAHKEKEKTVIRRVRCHQCKGCSRENCNKCRFCLDMKKNGGEGKLRQSCAMRFCENPQLPSYVVCNVCDSREDGELLMECHVCSEVVHPACIERNNKKDNKKLSKCKISKKVNNSWECPKCCQADEEETTIFSVNAVEKIVNSIKKENRNVLQPKGGKPAMSKVLLNKIQNGGKGRKKSFDLGSDGSDDEPLAKKRNRSKAGSENESDDEPLIKKKIKKVQENVTPKPVLNIVTPITVVRPAPLTNGHQHCTMVCEVVNGVKEGRAEDEYAKLEGRGETTNGWNENPEKLNGNSKEGQENSEKCNGASETPMIVNQEGKKVGDQVERLEKPHPLPRDLWIHVFSYLKESEVNLCMLVCKAWNQWCLDHKLWPTLRVTNKILNPSILKGIVRRQPTELVLSSTRVSAKQVEWLLNRLPRLGSLDLSLNTAAAVSSLLHVKCPPLNNLSVAWCDAVFDRFLSQVLAPLRNGQTEMHGRSRLHFLEYLNLTGCDIAYETMRNVFTLLPSLRELNVSFCAKVKDNDLKIIKDGQNVNKSTLKKIICTGCPLVTESMVSEIKVLPNMPEIVL